MGNNAGNASSIMIMRRATVSSAWEETAHAYFGVPEFGHFALARSS